MACELLDLLECPCNFHSLGRDFCSLTEMQCFRSLPEFTFINQSSINTNLCLDPSITLMTHDCRGHLRPQQVLLDAGASCSEQDGNGHDVAMLALRAADESCVTCIRQRGATVFFVVRAVTHLELAIASRNE